MMGLWNKLIEIIGPTVGRAAKAAPVLGDALDLGKSFLDFLPKRKAGVPNAIQLPVLRPIDESGGNQIGLKRYVGSGDFRTNYRASLERSPSYLAMSRAAQQLAGNIVNPNPGGPGRIVYGRQARVRGGNPARIKNPSSRTV